MDVRKWNPFWTAWNQFSRREKIKALCAMAIDLAKGEGAAEGPTPWTPPKLAAAPGLTRLTEA